jgi:hypothetical protein
VARRTGAKTRSRIASETPLTMWQGGPYFSKAASQSVVMVTQETVVRSAEGWTTHLTVGLEWSRRITHFARVSKVSKRQEIGTPSTTQFPRWRARQRAEQGVQTEPNTTRRHYLPELGNRVRLSRNGKGQLAARCPTRGGAFVVVGDRESLSHGEGRQLSSPNPDAN